MRSPGKVALILCLCLLPVVLAGQSKSGRVAAKGKTVHKAGKVETGVESGCLLVRDTKDYKLYHVLFGKGGQPKAGEEISFSGTLHDGPTTCMEGIPVDVSSWKVIKGASPEPKHLVAP